MIVYRRIPIVLMVLALAFPAMAQSVPGREGTVPPPAPPAPLSSQTLTPPGVQPPLGSLVTSLDKAPHARGAHLHRHRGHIARPVAGFEGLPPPPAGLNGQSFSDEVVGCRHYGTGAGVPGDQVDRYTASCAQTR